MQPKKIGYARIDAIHQEDLKNYPQNLYNMTSAVSSNHYDYKDCLI